MKGKIIISITILGALVGAYFYYPTWLEKSIMDQDFYTITKVDQPVKFEVPINPEWLHIEEDTKLTINKPVYTYKNSTIYLDKVYRDNDSSDEISINLRVVNDYHLRGGESIEIYSAIAPSNFTSSSSRLDVVVYIDEILKDNIHLIGGGGSGSDDISFDLRINVLKDIMKEGDLKIYYKGFHLYSYEPKF